MENLKLTLILLLLIKSLLKYETNAEQSPFSSQLKLSPSSLQQQSNNFFNPSSLQQQQSGDLIDSNSKCEPLNTDVLHMCKDIAYNETRYPNFMKQKSQQEAAADTAFYLPLIRINCSPVLKLFLCTLYAPPCVANYTLTLKPCREMCEKAKLGCEDYMTKFQFSWPEYIDCWRFPAFNGAEACVTDETYTQQQQQQPSQMRPVIQSPNYQLTPNTHMGSSNAINPNILSSLNPEQQQFLLNLLTASGSQQQSPSNGNYLMPKLGQAMASYPTNGGLFLGTGNGYGLTYDQGSFPTRRMVRFHCPAVLQILSENKNTYYLNVNDEYVNNCAMPCDNNLFDAKDISFSRSWVLVWSAICFLSTLFTILTFLIETSRFRYPERPIIFLSGCYMIVALAYLIGSISQNSIVCQSQKNAKMQNMEYLVQGVEHAPCTLLFMMLYFFGMSSSIWWVVLTLTWFLAAGLKWGHEAIENIASYFHLAAWAIPGVKLIAILWLQRVEADVLSGVCYTGLRNVNVMRGFVVAPLFLYLILGTLFLIGGFVSLFRIRNVMKHGGNKTEKLEKFMIRIGVFSILYMIPAIIVICCYFYEQSSYNKWIESWLKRNSIEFNLPPDYVVGVGASSYEMDRSSLTFFIFMCKYAMLLVVGITSGFWIWSHKTVSSWQRFFDKITACLGNLRPKYKNEAAV